MIRIRILSRPMDVGKIDQHMKERGVVVGSELRFVILLARCQLAHEFKGDPGGFLLLDRHLEQGKDQVPFRGRSAQG